MIAGFVVLLLCQLAGEAASRGLGLPIPGPVLGLVLLFAVLLVRARLTSSEDTGDVGEVSDRLLQNLALLFVPAGVGVIQHLHLLAQHGLAIAAALLGSTVLTLVATVLVFNAVARRSRTPS